MKTLTKADINALKKSTQVIFRLYPDGKTVCECWNKPSYAEREKDPFARDMVHTFEVDFRVTDYGKGNSTKYEGFCSQDVYSFENGEGGVKLIANVAKEGWSIRAEWVCNNTSENMLKEGKVNTFMRIAIYNKAEKFIGAFRFEESTSEYDNNRICYPIN